MKGVPRLMRADEGPIMLTAWQVGGIGGKGAGLEPLISAPLTGLRKVTLLVVSRRSGERVEKGLPLNPKGKV